MRTRAMPRGGRLRAVALVASLSLTATATAATATSEAQTASAGVTIAGAGSHQKVRYGRTLRINGSVAPREPGKAVRLEHAPRGQGWRPVKQTQTQADGAYSFRVRARHSGRYRAVSESGHASGDRRVTVVARLSGRATRHVRRGRRVRVRGTLRPGLAGRVVRVQVRGRGRWRTVDRARTGRGGRFRASWRAGRVGRYRLRVRFAGDRLNAAARSRSRRVNVYRPGHASWYGPGFYGRRTACGQTITGSILGVAHKTLPCGTRVTFRYGRRTVTARVIDRGPYVAGREWDLTVATKRRLGFPSTGTVWSTR